MSYAFRKNGLYGLEHHIVKKMLDVTLCDRRTKCEDRDRILDSEFAIDYNLESPVQGEEGRGRRRLRQERRRMDSGLRRSW